MYCFLELINFFIALVLNCLLCVSKLLHINLLSCHYIVSIWREMETTVLDSQDPSKHEREGSPENKFKPRYLKILEGRFLPNYLMLA